MGQAARPQAEIMPSIEPSSPIINFKIEVINQVSGATVEAEQLDEQTVRIIVKMNWISSFQERYLNL